MKYKEIETEFTNRYRYIYSNAKYILAPYVHKETLEEKKRSDKRLTEYNPRLSNYISDKLAVYITHLDRNMLILLESFLLSDIPYMESELYKKIEANKKNKEFIILCKNNLELLKNEGNNQIPSASKILKEVRSFIELQTGWLIVHNKKTSVIDQYDELDRYRNIKTTYNTNNNLWSMVTDKNVKTYKFCNDGALKGSEFIDYISSEASRYDYNGHILTEAEKQNVYLEFHDELPWDLLITCKEEEKYPDDIRDTRYIRPNSTTPCGNDFYVDENKIFINRANNLYKYYQLCPCCGYMVNIPNEIITKKIRKRIEKRRIDFESMVEESANFIFKSKKIININKARKLRKKVTQL